jgi:acetyl-CoA C-acetyltransferase
MQQEAAMRAAVDTGVGKGLLKDLVGIGAPAMFLEMRWRSHFKEGKLAETGYYKNFCMSVANSLGAKPDPAFTWYSEHGGNGPMFLVSSYAELIAKGKIPQGPILIGGVEENATFDRAARAGRGEELKGLGWGDAPGNAVPAADTTKVNILPVDKTGRDIMTQTRAHVPGMAINWYGMLENAYRHDLGRSFDEHHPKMAGLWSRFSVVAAANPEHAWYPEERTVDWLLTPSNENRRMAFPYTKWMCARDEVDMSSAAIMMSAAEAKRRGIPEERLVYLWGTGDAYDTNVMGLRRAFGESLSMKAAYEEAFRSAGLDLAAGDAEKVAAYDIYSCFPVAVEQACRCLGLDPDTTDVSRLTATGGLPYHGGPGSNYSGHGLCALIAKLRLESFRDKLGMVCANGGNLTEHGTGIFSTAPPPMTYSRRDPAEYKPDCELPKDQFAFAPNGKGKVVTWTVSYKKKPEGALDTAIIIGEMTSGPDAGKRFIAVSQNGDEATMNWMVDACRIGAEVDVVCDGKKEQFTKNSQIYRVWFAKPSATKARL